MNKALKYEFKKMFHKTSYKIVLLIGAILAVMESGWAYKNIYKVNLMGLDVIMRDGDMYHDFFPTGILECWLGCESHSVYNQLFIKILPLLAVIPFAITFCDEWRTGYSAMVVTQCGRKKYVIAKAIAVFVSGGIGVSFPLILSILCAGLYVPNMPSNPRSMQVYLSDLSMWSELYFEKPILYVIAYTFLICFIFGGIYALLTMVISFWSRNRFVSILFPFVLQMFLTYGVLAIAPYFMYIPEAFLNPSQPVGIGNRLSYGVLVGIQLVAMLVLSLVIYIKNRKVDVLR